MICRANVNNIIVYAGCARNRGLCFVLPAQTPGAVFQAIQVIVHAAKVDGILINCGGAVYLVTGLEAPDFLGAFCIYGIDITIY